jgi:ABC-type transporter Mla subunit MlaD
MNVDSVIQRVNDKNGTISQLDKVLTDTRVIVAHSDRLLTQQQKSLVKFDGQLSSTIADLNETLISVKQTSNVTAQSEQDLSQASVDAIKGLAPVLVAADSALVQLSSASQSLNQLVSDPALKSTLDNLNSSTTHINATTADVQQVVHGYLHPTWAHRIYGWTLDVAHALNPL